jgi:hypothetical protein
MSLAASLTLNTLVFTKAWSDKDSGVLFEERSRGAMLPTKLLIRTQDAIDSATKLPASRTSSRFEYHEALADGTIVPTITATLTVSALKQAVVTTAHILAVVDLHVALMQEDDSGLDLAEEIYVNKEQ